MSGTWISVSKLPMLPVWFSRTTNLTWYLPGASVKPGGVLHVPLLHLLVRVEGQLHRLPHLAHRDALAFFTCPRMSMVALSLSFAFTVDLRPRHHHRDGDVEPAVVQPEVQRLQVDRDVRGRHVAAHLLRQRQLAVLALGVLEVRRRIVSGPVFELRFGWFSFTVRWRKLPSAPGWWSGSR